MVEEIKEIRQKGFVGRLERLLLASRTGDFSVRLDDSGLASEESDAIRLLNAIISNYRTAVEYGTMKYKLTSDALGIALWDMDVIVDDPVNPINKFTWSPEIRYMLGYKDENDFPNLLNSWSDKLHPEDKARTLNAFAAHINDHSGKTPYDLEYRLMLKNGQYRHFHAFGTTLRNSYGVPIRVAGALEDIEEQTRMRETMEYRNNLLNTLDEMDVALLSQKYDDFDEVMSDRLRPVAVAAGLSRIVIYGIVNMETDRRFGQIYRWDGAEGGLISFADELQILPSHPVIDNWIDILSEGGVINRYSSMMSEGEAAFVGVYGIKSILLTPVITNDGLWGAFSFQDHENERLFDEDCVSFLSSAARLCANAIIRNEKTRNEQKAIKELEKREKLMRALTDTAIMFLSHKDDTFEDMMTAGINLIAETADMDRISVWRNYEGSDGQRTTQIYRWDWFSGGTTTPTAGLDFSYKQSGPYWQDIFRKGGSVNSPVNELPDFWPETALLKRFGVVSVFITPVFIDKALWGFVMFEDRRKERYFDNNSADMMHIAAFLCANTVMRAEMEREIIRVNQLNQSILETMPIGLNIFDDKMNIKDTNSVLTDMLKTTKKQYKANFFKFSPEYQPDGSKSLDRIADYIKRSMTGEKLHYEWLYQTSRGVPVPCEITLTRVKCEDEFIGLAFIYDLRRRKKLEQDLIAAKEFAEQSSRYKSAFLANMSHEIRTPMNAILGIAEIQLRNTMLAPDTEEALGKIYESGNLLMGIINDILDLSKIEAGKLEVVPAKYDIPSLVNDSAQLNLLRYSSKPIEFSLEVDANTPLNLFGDELRIKQILNNILSNAYKYTDKGEVTLSVSAEYEDIDDDNAENTDVTIIFRVIDTGQGMTEEQVSKLFDEYTRFNTDANRTTIGTGLGMSITKRLIELMDGEILVESEAGRGSTFTIRLPQKRVDSLVCGNEMSENIRNFRFHSRLITKKAQILREYMPYGSVLVVDDVESNLYVAEGMLLPYGLKIETAASGFAAIEKVRDGKSYDIIFMDHMMPKMDGIETVKIIRDMGYKDVIVALTANALVGQAKIFMENGFDGYISKPIDSREMNAILNDFIRDRKPPGVVEAARHEQHEKGHDGTASNTDEKVIPSELEKYCVIDSENAVTILSEIHTRINNLTDADIAAFTVTVHGMKSALANVGERALSDAAYKLEQAGKERNLAVISNKTQAFIDSLRALIGRLKQKLEPTESSIIPESAVEDTEYLREKLLAIKTACAAFDANTARLELDELMKKTWSHQTSEALDDLNLHLLHSAFRKVVAAAAELADKLN